MLQERLEKSERWGDSQINEHQNHGYNSSWDGNDSTITGIDKGTADMGSVHRHLTSLERQQLSMMEMLQVSFLAGSWLIRDYYLSFLLVRPIFWVR